MAVAAVGPALVVGLKIRVQVLLHLLDGLVPGRPSLDPEMLLEERAMESLDEAVRLGPPDLRWSGARCPRSCRKSS